MLHTVTGTRKGGASLAEVARLGLVRAAARRGLDELLQGGRLQRLRGTTCTLLVPTLSSEDSLLQHHTRGLHRIDLIALEREQPVTALALGGPGAGFSPATSPEHSSK